MFDSQGPTFWELAVQALSSTERGYDLLAPRFDHTPFRTPDELLEAVAPHVGSVDSALDLCCGTGAGLQMLRPLCGGRLVGIDFSQGMLDVARDRLADGTPVELVHGNVLAMPFRAEFDLATCFAAFGHILPEDQPRFVREIAATLISGGRFVFITTVVPPFWTLPWLACRAFNALMRIRNAIWSPPFVMYYLTFTLDEATRVLEAEGFQVEVIPSPFKEAKDNRYLRLVVATRSLTA